jgi:hypothetical protein
MVLWLICHVQFSEIQHIGKVFPSMCITGNSSIKNYDSSLESACSLNNLLKRLTIKEALT